ncbi:MAG: zinc ribbon domain-containing protein [Deltaproteobacteria bacterium]|nr:zinc ribbon domain-containing protein [Deltaproteobacteria bacterium]MBW2085939.1 zinc ribbon domain-containing protein [Deltaproteobacteria bacterium]
MPIYEYRCKACGNVTEFLVSPDEEIAVFCSHCDSHDMEKIMSVASFLGDTTERIPGQTCCGREERCDSPPCSTGGSCRRG